MDLTLLKQTHIALVVVSISFYAMRFYGRQIAAAFMQWRVTRILPHLIDTLLLVSGFALVGMMRLFPTAHPWLFWKLVLVVLYIVLGIGSMRAVTPRRRNLFFALAMVCVGAILYLALYKPFY